MIDQVKRFLPTFADMRIHIFFTLSLMIAGTSLAEDKPLKVFVLAGQSNMQGHAEVRTFDHIGMDPATAPMLGEMRDDDGSPTLCDQVWISSIGSSESEKTGRLTAGYGPQGRGPKIGPEFTFGIYATKLLQEPILIIKTAWGGKSLHTDFRPPSAGPFVFSDTQLENLKKQNKDVAEIQAAKEKATGHYYRLMIKHVKHVLGDIKRVYPDYDDQGFELAGFVWFQGWNDMVDRGIYPNRDKPGGYDRYSELLTKFIRDVRKDLDAPKLPFVIGVMGAGGPVAEYSPEKRRYAGIHQHFRDAMAAPAELPEFQGSVVAVRTEQFWDLELEKLRTLEARIKQKVKQRQKDESLSRDDTEALRMQLMDDAFSDREQVILRTAVSNFEFHYLGCAKILGQIGKAFAEAAVELASR